MNLPGLLVVCKQDSHLIKEKKHNIQKVDMCGIPMVIEANLAGFQVLHIMSWLIRAYCKAIFMSWIVVWETTGQFRMEKGIVKFCSFPKNVFRGK